MHLSPARTALLVAAAAAATLRTAGAACVPDFPAELLADPRVLEHVAVRRAFEQVAGRLAGLYADSGDGDGKKGSRDGLSFAVVCFLWFLFAGAGDVYVVAGTGPGFGVRGLRLIECRFMLRVARRCLASIMGR
jgi:hypothetical protein